MAVTDKGEMFILFYFYFESFISCSVSEEDLYLVGYATDYTIV